jgi:hypothetical protein
LRRITLGAPTPVSSMQNGSTFPAEKKSRRKGSVTLAIRIGRRAMRGGTTVETWIIWNANGVATKQIFQMGQESTARWLWSSAQIVAKIATERQDGRRVGARHRTVFTLAWFLKKNGLSVQRRPIAISSAAAAQAFVAGQNDAAMTYERIVDGARHRKTARSSRRRSIIRW